MSDLEDDEIIEQQKDQEFLERYRRLVPQHDHATNTWSDIVRTGPGKERADAAQ